MHKLNEMMDKPVINEDVRNFLRTNQKQLNGKIGDIEKWANENRVPIIPHETVVFFNWLLPLLKPEQILEVGTAIGFSAALMLEAVHMEGHVTTIERNPDMISKAKANFKTLGIEENITLLEGQADEWLEKIESDSTDFIFMDSAKAKYYSFFPDCFRVLKIGGVLAVDDVLQGGTILDDEKEVPKRVRKIHRKLNEFLAVVLDHPSLDTSLIPVGDGLLLITKRDDADFDFMRQTDK
ncbi:O-methyltransferase [Alkalibacterium olivapovliticus]|uniref:tRNA 5-hydroxyuridine methyltransferase n=1 Tax=Alkalibacterium olivapovliticus TaxID=99907 RepID=A0A2T0VQX3_9LACT|nr:O-methyltransferase [Alkalibacterium olivapovliticus]PRY72884.1 putative O-methyltransferase YrrM [Alkalibacterium olivapovliticus]